MSGTVGTNAGRGSGSIGEAASGPTVSASNPTTSTNSALGTQWANSSTGAFYIMTTATAGSNVWTNVDAAGSNIAPFHFTSASLYCFAPGGSTTGDSNRATIDKNAFASDANSTDQGDLTVARRGQSQSSSTTHGYSQGGYTGAPFITTIDKFAMGSTADSAASGDLTVVGQTHAGVTSTTHGHAVAGSTGSNRRVDRYAFGSGTQDAVSLGDLISVARNYPVGASSSTHGYVMGSYSGDPVGQIEKFAFADNATTADVGDLVATSNCASHSEDGYVWTSGQFNAPASTKIEKMATASDANSVASGSTLSVACSAACAGNSSATYGYTMGGLVSGPHGDVVDKWPFNSDSTASDVGNLSLVRESVMFNGNQL